MPSLKGARKVIHLRFRYVNSLCCLAVILNKWPRKSKAKPQFGGNDIRRFPKPFKTAKEYSKALRYLFNYLRRKEKADLLAR